MKFKIFKIEVFFFVIFYTFFCSWVWAAGSVSSSKSPLESDKKFLEAWNALEEDNYNASIEFSNQCIEEHEVNAKKLNLKCANLKEDASKYFECSELTILVQCLFIKLEAYRHLGKYDEVNQICDEANKFYYNGYVIDPRGYPWKLAEGCKDILKYLKPKLEEDQAITEESR